MSSTESSLLAYLLFAVIGLLLYVLFFKRYKWVVLLILSYSLIFYLSSYWMIFLISSALIVYITAIIIDNLKIKFNREKEFLEKEKRKILKNKIKRKQRIVMIIGVILSLSILVLLKYLNLPIGKIQVFFQRYSFTKIAFPILGISYYVLTSVGYLIDIGRGKYDAERNFFKLALFIGFFPTQIEGPFQRYDKSAPYLYKQTNPTYADLSGGGVLIIWGLFKKIVIADRLNIVVSEVFNNYSNLSGFSIFIGMLFYAFQLYTDFSGYIDIARGTSKLFGIELEENFDRPFMSRTVKEFWRRWHISLGAWLRDYVFYSVALSKPYMAINKKIHGKVSIFLEKFIQTAIPTLFVWLICGIWHGAGIKYIAYGMYYYVIMMLGILMEPIHNVILNKLNIKRESPIIQAIMIVRTFTIVLIGLTMFRANSLTDFGLMIKNLFKAGSFDLVIRNVITLPDMIISVVCIVFIVGIEIISEFINLREVFDKSHIVIRYSLMLALIFIIIMFGAYGANYAPVDPMYALY